jgi:type IV pilus assembly protein PilY1
MKTNLFILLTIPLLMFTVTLGHSDDTEIYLNTNAPGAGKPLVMIALDFRSNVVSSVCQGDVSVPTHGCYKFFYKTDASGNTVTLFPNLFEKDGTTTMTLPLDPTNVNFNEVLIGALNLVMLELNKAPPVGVGEDQFKLGLMLSHNDEAGTGQNKGFDSDGGYIFLGFHSVNETYRKEFVAKLAGMNTTVMNSASTTNHPFQGAEMFFELFRYLTGQNVYKGHTGYNDFNSTDAQKNIGYSQGFYPAASSIALPGVILPPIKPPATVLSDMYTDPQIGWDATIETVYVSSTTGIPNNIGYPDPNSGPYNYKTPITEACSRVFTLSFLHGVSNQDADADNDIEETKANGGMGITLNPNTSSFDDVLEALNRNYFDDGTWGTVPDLGGTANVTSFFFTNGTPVRKVREFAASGGGTAVDISGNPDEVVSAIKSAFLSILSVSTSFVSATVPVNVFNRSESLDNVFFGIFEIGVHDDGTSLVPQWPGNVKRLRLRVYDDNNPVTEDPLEVVGADCPSSTPDTTACTEAIDNVDNRIKHNTLSYWTDANSFDVNTAIGTVRRYNGYDAKKNEVSGRDGRSVKRGGAGQQILGFISDAPSAVNGPAGSTRQIFTEAAGQTNGAANTLEALNGDATTAELLWEELCPLVKNRACNITVTPDTWTDAASINSGSDAVSANDQEAAINLLKFNRGIDVYDRDKDFVYTDSRPWLFSDILHTQPAPLNYGATGGGYTQANPELYVLTASNDGFVRMIRNNDGSGTPDGEEVWAFMPRELLPILGDLRGDPIGGVHPYGVDGAISIYTEGNEIDGTISGSDKAIAYFGLRRGGDSYYALDISDPNSPKILWKISKTSGGNFDELGQTWSRPRIRQMAWQDTNSDNVIDIKDRQTVVIFGGGYDKTKDNYENLLDASLTGVGDINENNKYVDNEGNALFIVDALDGSLIWKATKCSAANCTGNLNATEYNHEELRDSIPSDVTPVDSDSDGLVDLVYIADTGGVIWRADLPLGAPASWTITPIFSAGRHAVDSGGNSLGLPDRRFFHRPDMVAAENSAGTKYFAALIGSGNRPFPRQEHDKDANGKPQYDQFYAVKDFNTTIGSPPATVLTPADLADVTSETAESLDTGCKGGSSAQCAAQTALQSKGWYFSLINDDGEKLLASSVTFFGKTFFSTYVPSGGSSTGQCVPPEGSAYTYVVSLEDGAPVFNFGPVGGTIAQGRSILTGSGIPGDPVVISIGGPIFISPGNLPNIKEFRQQISKNPLRKTYWYESTEE